MVILPVKKYATNFKTVNKIFNAMEIMAAFFLGP